MKSGTPLFRFPFVSRKRHDAIVNHLYKTIDKLDMEIVNLINELYQAKRTRNAKGQFERRSK